MDRGISQQNRREGVLTIKVYINKLDSIIASMPNGLDYETKMRLKYPVEPFEACMYENGNVVIEVSNRRIMLTEGEYRIV
ncbi:MAG: hypothetical protein ACLTDM_18800 [Clostridium butyricum]